MGNLCHKVTLSNTEPGPPSIIWNNNLLYSWLEIGEEAKAQDLFVRSYDLYVREPFKVSKKAYLLQNNLTNVK